VPALAHELAGLIGPLHGYAPVRSDRRQASRLTRHTSWCSRCQTAILTGKT
jgi:hypothetical protein